MTNKTLLSSFILLSISIVFSIISLVFFGFFNQDIARSYVYEMCPIPINCSPYTWYIIDSNIQMHYFPGLIFYCIYLFIALAGIILFIVNFLRKRSIRSRLLKYSLVIFALIIAVLLPISLLSLQFQVLYIPGLPFITIVGIILIIANYLRHRVISRERIDKEAKNDDNTGLSKNETDLVIYSVVIAVIVTVALFPVYIFAIAGAVTGIIIFIVNILRKRKTSEKLIDKETVNDGKTRLLENSFVIFIVVIALLLISLVYFIRFQGVIQTASTTLTYSPDIGKLVHIFYSVDNLLFNYAGCLFKISVFLIITGIILIAKYIFRKNKVIKPQKGA